MKVQAIDFVFYSISDLKKAKTFYRDILGIRAETLYESETWVEFDTQPVALALGKWEKPGASIALAVDDVPAAIAELQRQGVRVLGGPFDTPVCTFAAISDPDGNVIFLHQRKDGTAG